MKNILKTIAVLVSASLISVAAKAMHNVTNTIGWPKSIMQMSSQQHFKYGINDVFK